MLRNKLLGFCAGVVVSVSCSSSKDPSSEGEADAGSPTEVPGEAGSGGSGGSAGESPAAGGGGAEGGQATVPGTGGADGGQAGTAGAASGGAGAAGEGGGGGAGGAIDGPECGAQSQACCASASCDANLACLGGSSCSCVKSLAGAYVIRADGVLLHQSDPPAAEQQPVLYASSALPMLGAVTVSHGESHACAVLDDGTVWCWPEAAAGNGLGQLGNGSTATAGPVFRATQVLKAANSPLTGVASLSGVSSRWAGNTCAVTTTGNVWCWGDLTWTVGGGITTTVSPYATQITTDGVTPFAGVSQVSVEYGFACAIVQGSASKEVWCWGSNGYGQLGSGDTTARRYPTRVLGIADPKKVVVSQNGYGPFACAIDGDRLRCWGSNETGQLGLGMAVGQALAPTLVTLAGGVTPLTGVVDFEGGAGDNIRSVSCALTSAGNLLVWGYGYQNYAAPYGVPNVVSIGSLKYGVFRYLTSDGVYHAGTKTRSPSCAPL